MIEIFGPESSGKTTVCLHAIAEFQKKGDECAFIDVEHSFDPVYAQAIGANSDNLYISQPSSAEETLSICKSLIKAREIGLVIVDSIAGLATRQEIEGDIGDANISSVARLLSQQLKQISELASSHSTTVIFTNQVRQKPGVMYGNPEYTPGGNAIRFFSSQRVRISRDGTPDDNGSQVDTKAKFVKNKCGSPFKTCEFSIEYGKGIDNLQSLASLCEKYGIVIRKGSQYLFKGDSLGQGKEAIKNWLKGLSEKNIGVITEGILKRAKK